MGVARKIFEGFSDFGVFIESGRIFLQSYTFTTLSHSFGGGGNP